MNIDLEELLWDFVNSYDTRNDSEGTLKKGIEELSAKIFIISEEWRS